MQVLKCIAMRILFFRTYKRTVLAVLTLHLLVMYVIAELLVVTNSEEDGSKNGGLEDAKQ